MYIRYTLTVGSVAVDDDGSGWGGTVAAAAVETGTASTLGLKFDANGLLAVFHLML